MIQATFFNDSAEKFTEIFREGSVYLLADGQVKMANKRFTSIKNDFCLIFDKMAEIEEVAEDKHINVAGFSFTSLAGIEELVQKCVIDVIGVVLDGG